MIRISSAVQKIITARIAQYIKYAVEKPFYGLVTGVISTIIFQSSSASTAMTIGLVSTGLISFSNSLAIILGADIGTTLTVQLVVWRFTEISPLIISAGGLLWLTGRNKWKIGGEIIFYFGLIFFGLELLNEATEPLKQSTALIDFFTSIKNPFVGIILGIIVTGIVQASAVPITILAILAQQDLVLLENAVPVIMGANIGTTVTALLAGMVATVNGKRAAVSHLLFKCIGVLICLLLMPYFLALLRFISSSTAQQIALAHFLLNLFIVLAFIFFLTPLARIIAKILPGHVETLTIWPEFLDQRDLAMPDKALEDVRRELLREMGLVRKMFRDSMELLVRPQERMQKGFVYIEAVINNLRIQIVNFLRQISARPLAAKPSKRLFEYTAMANDIKSIGNHVILIVDLVVQKANKKITFSEYAEREMSEIISLIDRNVDDATSLIEKVDAARVKDVIEREEEVDVKVKEARDNHLKRFHQRLCLAEAGPFFVEILIHLERISDLCNNIAEYISEIEKSWSEEKSDFID